MTQSCRKATELISKAMDQPLRLRERLALGFHLAVCHGCRQFRRQVRLMRQIVRNAALGVTTPSSAPVPGLSKEAKARIDAALRDAH